MEQFRENDDILSIRVEFISHNEKDIKELYDILKESFNVDIELDKFRQNRYNPLWENTIVCKKLGSGEIIACGTLELRKSLTRKEQYGSIENVAVKKKYQGMGYGKYVVRFLFELAKELHCYKVVLSCSEKNMEFYEKCGFSRHEIQMRRNTNG